MDQALEQITDFTVSVRPETVPDNVIEHVTGIFVDSIACAMAARDCPGALAAAKIPALPRGDGGTVIGSSAVATLDMAAFWNTSMIRYLDYNDTFTGGHPSDIIGALIAVAGAHRLAGRGFLSGIAISYEVFHRISLRHRSYRKDHGAIVDYLSIDQGFAVAIATAAGIAHMLDYDRAKTRTAVSLSATNGLPLRASRAGELSHYKGVATAASTRQAVFACQLAEYGLTGPSDPFEGRHGFIEVMEGKAGSMNLEPFGEWAVLRSGLKYFPATANSQIGVWAALKLREGLDLEKVSEIVLHTSRFLRHESGSEPAKWAPTTRETADHSLPYIVAVALLDGGVTLSSYTEEMLSSPKVRGLMKKIKVEVDEKIESEWPGTIQIRATAKMADGSMNEVQASDPKGTYRNPMNREDIKIKFRQLVEPVLASRTDSVFDSAWNIVASDDCQKVFDQLVVE
ncbi:MmgE/PrpD family protein [Caballeronia sordidicola]|uniref:MmgE/PrpD family protein n=1 Tax=Caballeronia sordidicola TaxID=196367 RepID=A0A158I1C0_CABSO|nr:MmgE/PrpD family protein [Caballeronia sordidicola]SAL49901.1 MmgE/PrpD family protein [Caballeronia sordidicola]